ncbi:unnamed protein product, partial [Iphiclides podalirius]
MDARYGLDRERGPPLFNRICSRRGPIVKTNRSITNRHARRNTEIRSGTHRKRPLRPRTLYFHSALRRVASRLVSRRVAVAAVTRHDASRHAVTRRGTARQLASSGRALFASETLEGEGHRVSQSAFH